MTISQTFLGQKMSQDYQDFPLWEEFFETNKIATFIELGTGNGGMSLYFALQCLQREIKFHTFDNQKFFDFDHGISKLMKLWDHFHFVDLFTEGIPELTQLILASEHPIAIFFDDGDKPREWKLFAHLLSPGDFCIVHDWGTEFWEKDLAGVPVERLMPEKSDLRMPGWKAMWFIRKDK